MPSRKSIANEEDWGDQPALFDTSVEIFRYLVVISPSQEMIAEVGKLKQKIFDRIGTFRGDRSIAHMTLLFAYLPIEYERHLIEGINSAIVGARPIHMEFNGIDQLPNGSGIFIHPTDEEQLIALQRKIRRNIQSNKQLKRLGIHATSRPMIHIARKLDPERSAIALETLSHFEFLRSETVEEVILLRSGLKEGEKHKIVAKFPLQ